MNIPIFMMLVGLPGSGKSTYASDISKDNTYTVCSSDFIRKELYGDENSQEHNDDVFKILHTRIKNNLKNGLNAIYDATNINSKRRRAFLSELKNIKCIKKCVIFATPYDKCIENNNKRERTVPESVIRRMYMNWNTPYEFEGWDNIEIKTENPFIMELPTVWINNMQTFNQDNPHHNNSLGVHCDKVARMLCDNEMLYNAGLIHDCGKPFTKTFTNCKGEKTNIAHYYNHQNVGAYDSLFFVPLGSYRALDVSIIVNLHMQPYFWEKDIENGDKTREKFRKLWGEKLFNEVMRLHIADIESH